MTPYLFDLRRLQSSSARPIAAPTSEAAKLSCPSTRKSNTGRAPLWGFLRTLGRLLALVVCAPTSLTFTQSEAFPQFETFVGRDAHVAGELLQIDARRNLSFEHASECPSVAGAVLSASCGEGADEGGAA